MDIPKYRLRSLVRRLERISSCARCDYTDIRTANALRLLRSDIAYLNKQLNKYDTDG